MWKTRGICLLALLVLLARAEYEKCGMDALPNGQPARGRILGSEIALRCEWPWMVSVRRRGQRDLCPGVLVGKNKVLTTARCANALERLGGQIEVVIGEYNIELENEQGETIIPISSMTSHPEFDRICVSNDIAVIRLKTDVIYGDCSVPACLTPSRPEATCDDYIEECVIAGWGKYKGFTSERSPKLRWAYTHMLGPNVCSAIYRYGDNSTLPENVFCLDKIQSNQPACLGDEGGMVMCNVNGKWSLKGLISLASCDDILPTLAVDLGSPKVNDFITEN